MSQNQDDQFGGIFDMTAEDIKAQESQSESTKDPDFYRPSVDHKNAKNKEYTATLRFLPNIHTRGLHVVKKYCYYLPDGNDPQKKYYTDCPSNGGMQKNIISQAFFDLKDHDSAQLSRMAKEYFKRKEYYWRLVLVMEDKQQPDMENLAKIIRYGKKVEEKITIQGTEDPKAGKKSVNVLDPFYGKNFRLSIKEIKDENNRTISSYDSSYFFDDRTPIMLGGVEIPNTEKGKAQIFEWLKANTPDLSKVAYKPWDEEEEERVINSVRALIEDDGLFNRIYKKVYGKQFTSNFNIPKAETSTSDSTAVFTQGAEEKANDLKNTVAAEKSDKKTAKKSDEKEEKSEKKSDSIVGEDGKIDYGKTKINFEDID